jgi:Domain of unknown function DUF11
VVRLVTLIGLGIVFAGGLGSATSADLAATADLSIALGVEPPPVVAKAPFGVRVAVGNAGPDRSHFRVQITLPSGIHLVSGESLECTGDAVLSCVDADAEPGFDGSAKAVFAADSPGTYTIVGQLVELSATDPNLANNQASLTVSVAAASAQLAATRLSTRPRAPVAGHPVIVSFRIVDQESGSAVRPAAATCSVNLGRRSARVVGNAATCTVRTPVTAHRRTLRGTLAATASGTRFVKRFAVRLR